MAGPYVLCPPTGARLRALEELNLYLFRGTAIFLTQLPLILFIGAVYDLIFGFNRMDAGFSILLFLFIFVPIFNLSWTIAEVILAIKGLRQRGSAISFLMPLVAFFFLIEAVAIDLYILSHARM